jgi:hypothetical protein
VNRTRPRAEFRCAVVSDAPHPLVGLREQHPASQDEHEIGVSNGPSERSCPGFRRQQPHQLVAKALISAVTQFSAPTRPQAALACAPERPSDQCGEIGSAALARVGCPGR